MRTIAAILLLSVLAACNGDGASPFDAPDKTAEPVTCAASASCG